MSGMAEILDENTALRERGTIQDVTIRGQAAELHEQAERLREQAEQIAVLQEQIEALKSSNDLFTKRFEFLEKKRQLAVAERFIADQNQAQLFADSDVSVPPRDPEVEEDDAARPDEPQDKRKTPKHRRRGRRKVAELKFPKKTVIAPVTPSTCTDCGGDRELIEPKITHRVGWEPGRFVVIEVHQEQCTCPRCPEAGVLAAPEPFLLPGAMCDDALLVRVLIDKFGDHVPLNRQARRMTREGFQIGTNVLSGWVRNAFMQVRPLVKAVQQQTASGSLLQTDDSGFPVQDGIDGRLANGRMWVFTDRKQAFFGFSRTKEGEHPAELLSNLGVSGRLIADGGSEYNKVTAQLGLERGGCWSHMRRYFFDAAVQHDEAQVALTAIRDVFMIERDLADLTSRERLKVRKKRSQPVVDGFYDWVKGMSVKTRPKSLLGQALGYAINQEDRMRLFLSHGDVPIHNNLSELLLRQPIVGRKNWLFSGSEGGAEAAMGWFTLISSCMLQSIDPAQYLYDAFRRLPDHSSKWVHELTPLNWRIAVEAGDITPLSPGQLA